MKKVLVLILTVVLFLYGCEAASSQSTVAQATPTAEATTEPEDDRKEVTRSLLQSATKDYDCEISVYDFGDGLDVTLSFGKSANAWVFYDVTVKATDMCKTLREKYEFHFKQLTVISGTVESTMLTWKSADLEKGVMADSENGKLYKEMTIADLKEYLGQ